MVDSGKEKNRRKKQKKDKRFWERKIGSNGFTPRRFDRKGKRENLWVT